jgi:hypothetical protein
MKRTTTAIATVFCAVFALSALQAAASESFTLDIPTRGNPQQETGKVFITLTLSAPSAGSQLVVNGNTTLNLGDTKQVAGDSVTFSAALGNDVSIVYVPQTNFSGAGFCNAQNAIEKQIPMRFSGPQDVTAYRITSYIVASPTVECSAVSKHTGDTPAFLIPVDDGVAPALVATNQGRHTFDVVLVLDKSGSMADFPPGAISGASKAEILRSAMKTFIAQWNQVDQPTPDGAEWSHDRIGDIFFSSAAAVQTLQGADPPTNMFVQRGNAATAWLTNISNIDTLAPGGSTSVGGGINEAMKQWKLDPANDLDIILVTDGIQNTAPLITVQPSGFLGLTPVSGFPLELRQRFIPIHTIGFGTPAAVDATLLTNISFETSGASFISTNATTMFDSLGMTLVSILKGNTLSMAMVHHDTMTGTGPSSVQPTIVDKSAQRVVFTVQWAPPVRDALDLEVFRPNGTAAVPTSGQKTPQSAIQTFNITPSDIGTWRVRVKRGLNKDDNAAVPYTLNALVLERHLDYTLSVQPGRAATGDTLTVRAIVDWDGKRLGGLPAGAIRVRVLRPSESIGTILHDAKFADPATGITTTPSGDTLTPYDRKLAALAGEILKRTRPTEAAVIELKEESKGVYAGTFDQTSIAGTYDFDAALDWDDSRTGHVQRVERVEQTVKVKPDPARTTITVTRPQPGTFVIAVTPRDQFGNDLGPGYGSLVKARLNGTGRVSGPVDNDSTGTYVFTIVEAAGSTLDVEIIVDGVVMGNPGRK